MFSSVFLTTCTVLSGKLRECGREMETTPGLTLYLHDGTWYLTHTRGLVWKLGFQTGGKKTLKEPRILFDLTKKEISLLYTGSKITGKMAQVKLILMST